MTAKGPGPAPGPYVANVCTIVCRIFIVFSSFFNINYLDPYTPHLEEAESNGTCLKFCNPWESG